MAPFFFFFGGGGGGGGAFPFFFCFVGGPPKYSFFFVVVLGCFVGFFFFFFFFGGGGGGTRLPVFILIGWCAANNHVFCSWAQYSWQMTGCKWRRTKCGRVLCLPKLALWTVCYKCIRRLR